MKRIVQFIVLGTVLGVILSALFIAVPWFPTEGSQQSKNNYPLFIAITYVSFVIFAVVIVAMGYSLWKFRRSAAPPTCATARPRTATRCSRSSGRRSRS